jgi:hypothetical protein
VGEQQNQPQLYFNPPLRVGFQGSRVTSDGGLVLVRELDERLGVSGLIEQHLVDSPGRNTQLPLADLLCQSIYSRMAGYEDANDAERLAQDPTFRLIGSEKIWERGAALTSRLQSFETVLPTQEKKNLAGLAAINRELIAKAETIDSSQRVVLDMDSIEIPVYGHKNTAPPTGISIPLAITRCCCSTARAIVWRRSCCRRDRRCWACKYEEIGGGRRGVWRNRFRAQRLVAHWCPGKASLASSGAGVARMKEIQKKLGSLGDSGVEFWPPRVQTWKSWHKKAAKPKAQASTAEPNEVVP